jgi:hypothetical protein
MKAARYVDAFSGKLLANALSAIDSTLDQILYEIGAIQGW